MMRKITFSTLLLFCTLQTIAQHYIQDLDNNPIGDVSIYNADNLSDVVLTDENGFFKLKKKWNSSNKFMISHPLYEVKTLTFKQLTKNEIIFLEENENFLEEIVVTVNNNEELLQQRAERRIIINKREIEKLNPQTAADLVANKPGVSVQKTQAGGGSPNIRGNEANRILLMIDGVRMNNAIYRGGHLQNAITIDPAILANSEILYGPSSVIYGSDALGGVVHFRTRIPDLSDATNLNYYTSYTSGNKSLTTHFDVEYGSKKIAFLTSVTHSSFGETRMGNWRLHGYDDWGKVKHYFSRGEMKENPNQNIQVGSDYRQIDVLQKIAYKPTTTSRIIGNFQFSNSSNINRLDQLNDYKNSVLKYEDWYYGPQKRVFTSLTYEDWTKRKLYDKAEVILAYQNVYESRHTKKSFEDFQLNRNEIVDVYSINANFRKNNFGYGTEYTSNIVSSSANKYFPEMDSTVVFNATRYPTKKATMAQVAFYAKYEHAFNEKVKLNGGIRYTNTNLQGAYFTDNGSIKLDFDTFHQSNNDINWNSSLVYHPTNSFKIGAIVSTGFHAPNIDDISKYYEKGNNIVVPNLGLKSEYITNYELNFSKNIKKKHLFNLDVFYTRMRNPIIKVATFNVPEGYSIPDGLNPQSNINAQKAYSYGSSFYTSSQWNSHWSTRFDVTYTFGKITKHHSGYDDLTNALAHIPPLFGKFTVEHKNNNFKQYISVIFNGHKTPSSFDLAGVDNLDETPLTITESGLRVYKGTPAWFTLNYSTQLALSKKVTLQAGISNILDIHYKTFASGYSAMGRSLNLTLRAKL
ncbi:MAG: TonB-dependent receptor plug domain-containing protein [Flavobacteriales bacterium]